MSHFCSIHCLTRDHQISGGIFIWVKVPAKRLYLSLITHSQHSCKQTDNGSRKQKHRSSSKFFYPSGLIRCKLNFIKLTSLKYEEELHSAFKRLGIPPNPPNDNVFRISTVRGRGKCWRARRDIQPGTPLIHEEVLFRIFGDGTANNSHESSFPAFRELSCPDPATPQRRFDANNFQMTDRNQRPYRGIFTQASRINHSCIPNAYFAWNPDLGSSGRLTVYAIARIPPDAEILIDYRSLDAFKTRDERQRGRRHYGFDCTCPACQTDTEPGRKSEERRERMRVLKSQIAQTKYQDPSEQTIDTLFDLFELSKLLQDEGLVYPHLADSYHGQALWWWRERERVAGRTGMAMYEEECREKERQASRKKLELDIMANGHDSPEVTKTLGFMFT